MNRLRHAHTLARLVLVWFALTLGLAVAAPVFDPYGSAFVCSATPGPAPGGDTDPAAGGPHHGVGHCPLCASPPALPAPTVSWTLPSQPAPPILGQAQVEASPAPAPRRPPARGPPRRFGTT